MLQAESELVKIDINCHVQGDIMLECISLHDDLDREKMMYRAVFNTAFIRSNILMLNRDEIDILWDAKDLFPKDFRAEVCFTTLLQPIDISFCSIPPQGSLHVFFTYIYMYVFIYISPYVHITNIFG